MSISRKWANDPVLEPLQVTLLRVGRGLEKHDFRMAEDPVESFRKFILAEKDMLDLDAQGTGNGQHLSDVYLNALRGAELMREMGTHVERFIPAPNRNVRAMIAAGNVIAGGQMVNASLLTHLRKSEWYVCSTLVLLRPALELVIRGMKIAMGSSSEAAQFANGPSLPTEQERRDAEFKVKACCKELAPFIKQREPRAASPVDVYTWLCSFTHLDINPLWLKKPKHQDAYATIAYTAWLCAVGAELITGIPSLAAWPTDWPAKLPWDP